MNVQEQEKSWLGKVMEYQKNKDTLDDMDRKIQMNDNVYAKAILDSTALPEARQLDQEMLTIEQPASDAHPESVDVGKKISEGAFVGFAAGIVIIFLLGALDGRVMSVEDLTQRFDEPMLGVIPMQKRVNGQVELLKNNDQRQMFAESCRNIRSSLLYMDGRASARASSCSPARCPPRASPPCPPTFPSPRLRLLAHFAGGRRHAPRPVAQALRPQKRQGPRRAHSGRRVARRGHPAHRSEDLDFISCGHYPVQPGELLMSERSANPSRPSASATTSSSLTARPFCSRRRRQFRHARGMPWSSSCAPATRGCARCALRWKT